MRRDVQPDVFAGRPGDWDHALRLLSCILRCRSACSYSMPKAHRPKHLFSHWCPVVRECGVRIACPDQIDLSLTCLDNEGPCRISSVGSCAPVWSRGQEPFAPDASTVFGHVPSYRSYSAKPNVAN